MFANTFVSTCLFGNVSRSPLAFLGPPPLSMACLGWVSNRFKVGWGLGFVCVWFRLRFALVGSGLC